MTNHIRRSSRPAFRPDPDGWIPIAVVAILPLVVGLVAILYESLLHWR